MLREEKKLAGLGGWDAMVKTAREIDKILHGSVSIQIQREGSNDHRGKHHIPHVHLHKSGQNSKFASVSIPTVQNPEPQILAGEVDAKTRKAILEWLKNPANAQKAYSWYTHGW
jgi:hypothetical protein